MMVANIAHAVTVTEAQSPTLSSTIKQMAGLLWYNLLSEMNKNGISSGALGAGGDAFQSMFLWNIAQNDFEKYDKSLTTSTMNQIGGRSTTIPSIAVFSSHSVSVNVPFASQVTSPKVAPMADSVVSQATKFAQTIWPEIKQAANQLGVPASAILAQAALETGWGASAAGNNLFGMKAVDGQTSTVRATQEMIGGVLTAQNATFRDYGSSSASVADYVQHVKSTFPDVIDQSTISGFAQAMQQSGYATDNQYANKIITVAQSPLMAQVLQAVGGSAPLPP